MKQGNDQPGNASFPSGYATESNTTNGALTTGWDYSQCPTPHHAPTSQKSSTVSLPQRRKSVDDAEKNDEQQSPGNGKVGIRDRIQHLTWAWFTTTMSTGGLALALGQTPHQFRGLQTIGKAVFILDLALFAALSLTITARFALSPRGTLRASLTHPTEAFFFPTFWLSLSTIISNAQTYADASSTGPWLIPALRAAFWLYAACALLVAIALPLALFASPAVHARCGPAAAAPNWVLPVFPATLCGTLSGTLAAHQPPAHAMAMVVAGVSCQGLGWVVFCAVVALFLLRSFHAGLLPGDQRAAMFMMVGPPSFTALALVGNANALPAAHAYFREAHPGAADMLVVLATWTAVFLWCLAFWFFGLALGACLMAAPRVRWTPTWWAYVFPNVGFTIATADVGKELGSEGILWVASAMTVLLVAMWLFVAGAQVRAVAKGMVLWPGKDEDRDEPQVREMLKGC